MSLKIALVLACVAVAVRGACSPDNVFLSNAAGGSFSTPGYDEGLEYGSGEHCTWVIYGSQPEHYIAINVVNLETEAGYDTLKLTDGVTSADPNVELSGTATDVTYCSGSNTTYAFFKSDGSIGGRGFTATWREFLPADRPTNCRN